MWHALEALFALMRWGANTPARRSVTYSLLAGFGGLMLWNYVAKTHHFDEMAIVSGALIAVFVVTCSAVAASGLYQLLRDRRRVADRRRGGTVAPEPFTIECRFVRGDELVGRLAVARTRGEHDVVYVVGCVTNHAPRMGYIRTARVSAPHSELHGSLNVSVGPIPPNGQGCVPFFAHFRAKVRDSIDVHAIVPEVEIQEVLFKR